MVNNFRLIERKYLFKRSTCCDNGGQLNCNGPYFCDALRGLFYDLSKEPKLDYFIMGALNFEYTQTQTHAQTITIHLPDILTHFPTRPQK